DLATEPGKIEVREPTRVRLGAARDAPRLRPVQGQLGASAHPSDSRLREHEPINEKHAQRVTRPQRAEALPAHCRIDPLLTGTSKLRRSHPLHAPGGGTLRR